MDSPRWHVRCVPPGAAAFAGRALALTATRRTAARAGGNLTTPTIVLALPTPSGSSAVAGSPRATWPRSLGGLAFRSAALIVALQVALAAALYIGWLSVPAYALATILLPSVTVWRLARSHARLLRRLTRAMRQFEAGAPDAPAMDSVHDLADRLEQLHLRTLGRVEELLAERDAAQLAGQEKRRLSRHLNRAQRIARVGSWEWERKTNRVVCSEEVFRLLHVDVESSWRRRRRWWRFVHADDRRAFKRWLVRTSRAVITPARPARSRPDGAIVHLHVLGEGVRIAERQTAGVMGTIQDATERTHAIQQIHRLAYYDVLTELPNRSRFHEKLAETLDLARRTASRSRSCSSISTSSSASTTRSGTRSATTCCA